jgi:hypothetical protein
MNDSRRKDIIRKARLVLTDVLKNSIELFGKPLDPHDLFPLQMDIVIRDLLGLKYEEPVEFSSLTSLTLQVQTFETFGYMERNADGGKVVIPQNLKVEWRRFTAAHEVGHYILHPTVLHHRDRPLTGGERANLNLPPEEQEANLFAAYLLMPRKQVTQYFEHCFGGAIDGREVDPELAFWLGTVAGQSIDEVELVRRGVNYRALLVAQVSAFKGARFLPLADRFGVSPSAMGYQLKELGLVK